ARATTGRTSTWSKETTAPHERKHEPPWDRAALRARASAHRAEACDTNADGGCRRLLAYRHALFFSTPAAGHLDRADRGHPLHCRLRSENTRKSHFPRHSRQNALRLRRYPTISASAVMRPLRHAESRD